MQYVALLLVLAFPSIAMAACGPDAAPAAVQAYGITCETFSDGPFSLGTIDTLDTATLANPAGSCSSGSCKWYVNGNFSNSAIGQNCPGTPTVCPTTPTSTYTISSGNLALNRTSAYSPSRVDLLTCHASPSGPGIFGNLFSTPLYVEFNTSTITTGLDSQGAEVAVWGQSVAYMTGGVRNISTIELDMLEGGSGIQKFTNHINTTGTASQNEWFQEISHSIAGHANGTLILPQSRNPKNDGYRRGVVLTLDNGSITASNEITFGSVDTATFNSGGYATFTAPGGLPTPDPNTGALSSLNSDQICFYVGSGFNLPLTLTYFRVWQMPPVGPGGPRRIFGADDMPQFVDVSR